MPGRKNPSSMWPWKQDLLEDRGRIWTDYVCGRWRIGQGFSTDPNEVWALQRMVGKEARWVSDHKTLADAKRAAEELQAAEDASNP